jgi:hypothetical protein
LEAGHDAKAITKLTKSMVLKLAFHADIIDQSNNRILIGAW